MRINVFPALNGDCILVEYVASHYILIDGGYVNTYNNYLLPKLVEIANNGGTVDVVVVTHIDEDHISGIIKLLEEDVFPISIKEIWYNGYKHVQSVAIVSEEDEIYGIHRIRLGNKEPLAIEFTYVPIHFFSDIDNYNFEHISLYDYMKSKNHLPVKFNETMMMVEAGEKLQKHLHLPSATSIVNYIEFIGYDENGNLVEYTESYSRPDKLEVRFVTNDI